MSKSKGFTLIELLVVIAIIGILSSVVLASLNTARGKAANSAIKADLSNMRAQAEIYYDTNLNYTAVCTDVKIVAIATHAQATNGGTALVCNNAAAAYAIGSALKVTEGTITHWCVDSTGASKGLTAALGAGVTACP